MSDTQFIRVKKILGKFTTNSSGAVTSELDVAGQIVKSIVYATTTGAHVTIKELITGESLTLSGDTIFEKVVVGSATHLPLVNATDVTGSALGSNLIHPTADKAVVIVASGGNVLSVNAHLYLR